MFGVYEEYLPTVILGGVDGNVDDKRDLYRISYRWWLPGFRNICDDTRTGACSSGQCHLQRREGRLVEICRALRSDHFIGLQSTSDRTEPEEDSPVYTIRADKFRVYRFPWRQGSLFPFQALEGSDCHPREYLAARQRQTHLHATCTAGSTEAGPRRRGFLNHEAIPAAVPIESARETTQ